MYVSSLMIYNLKISLRIFNIYGYQVFFFYFSPFLGDEQNKKLYGKCNNPNGHGHNYVGKFFRNLFYCIACLGQCYAKDVIDRYGWVMQNSVIRV